MSFLAPIFYFEEGGPEGHNRSQGYQHLRRQWLKEKKLLPFFWLIVRVRIAEYVCAIMQLFFWKPEVDLFHVLCACDEMHCGTEQKHNPDY